MKKEQQKAGNTKCPTNLSLTADTVSLGNRIAIATRRSSFTNVVEWLVFEEGIRQGLVKPNDKKQAAFIHWKISVVIALIFLLTFLISLFTNIPK